MALLFNLVKEFGILSGKHLPLKNFFFHLLNLVYKLSFRCAKCLKLVECYSNLLLLRDGSPICEDCSYSCHACSKTIKDEAIMTGILFSVD